MAVSESIAWLCRRACSSRDRRFCLASNSRHLTYVFTSVSYCFSVFIAATMSGSAAVAPSGTLVGATGAVQSAMAGSAKQPAMSAKHIFLARFISGILLVVLLVNIDWVGSICAPLSQCVAATTFG